MATTPEDVARALRRGFATLDALAARTGADRETLVWAIEDAGRRGWIRGTQDGVDCGPDGLCGSSPPAVYSLTEDGRRAVLASS